MSLRKFARRLLSLDSARGYWKSDSNPKAKLGTELMEDRVVPAVTVDLTGNVATITNAASGESVTLSVAAGNLVVTAANNNVTATGGAAAAAKVGTIPLATVTALNIKTDAANFLDVTTDASFSNATGIRRANYVGSTTSDFLNFGASSNPNLYWTINHNGGGNDTFTPGAAGVHVLTFDARAAASTLSVDTSKIVTPGFGGGAVFFDFNALAADNPVSVNLNAPVGGSLATYTNQAVNLTAGTTAAIIGARGGAGNDTLIGNDQDNLLIGGFGSDTIVGNGGNDELAASIDRSPALAGTAANGRVTLTETTVVDLTQFTTVRDKFTTLITANDTPLNPSGKYAADVYARFGYLNMGEGAAFLTNPNFGQAELDADAAASAAFVPPGASVDVLSGGEGNDALYGFNNTRMDANGGNGDDIISGLKGSLPSTADGGGGKDVIAGGPGWYLIGGTENDTIGFEADPASSAVTYILGGGGDDFLGGNQKNVYIDAGEGADTVSLFLNDASVIITTNGSTKFDAGGSLGALPLVQKTTR